MGYIYDYGDDDDTSYFEGTGSGLSYWKIMFGSTSVTSTSFTYNNWGGGVTSPYVSCRKTGFSYDTTYTIEIYIYDAAGNYYYKKTSASTYGVDNISYKNIMIERIALPLTNSTYGAGFEIDLTDAYESPEIDDIWIRYKVYSSNSSGDAIELLDSGYAEGSTLTLTGYDETEYYKVYAFPANSAYQHIGGNGLYFNLVPLIGDYVDYSPSYNYLDDYGWFLLTYYSSASTYDTDGDGYIDMITTNDEDEVYLILEATIDWTDEDLSSLFSSLSRIRRIRNCFGRPITLLLCIRGYGLRIHPDMF